MTTHEKFRPGFQSSETSWGEVTIYQHGDDPIIVAPASGEFQIAGRREYDTLPSLVTLSTSKTMGAPSGTFSFQMKPSKSAESLFQRLVDDDWVDIVFYRHDQPWHVMRGLIDDIRRSRMIGGTGATSTVFTISGRCFAKIWEISPIWFSPFATEDLVSEAFANQVFQSIPAMKGNPKDAAFAYLESFLEKTAESAGVNWNPPKGMPATSDQGFLMSVTFMGDYMKNTPARKGFNMNHLSPSGTLWTMAQQFSDPMFTEMYADMLPSGDPFSPQLAAGDALAPGDALMTVVVRDRPFPVMTTHDVGGFQDQWDDLPVFTIPRQLIASDDLGRTGTERFNAFFVGGLLHQEGMAAHAVNIMTPLVNMEDISRHGMRRLDCQSIMIPDNLDMGEFCNQQRYILADWNVLNPYFLSGTVNLGVGRPDIKMGCRLRVLPELADGDEENYYIESVGHTWMFGAGVKTALGVTRGWIGDDKSLRDAVKKLSRKLELPEALTAEDYGVVLA